MDVEGAPETNKMFKDAYKAKKERGDYEVWTGLRIWKEGEDPIVNVNAGKTTYQLMDWDGASTFATTAFTLLASAALLQ